MFVSSHALWCFVQIPTYRYNAQLYHKQIISLSSWTGCAVLFNIIIISPSSSRTFFLSPFKRAGWSWPFLDYIDLLRNGAMSKDIAIYSNFQFLYKMIVLTSQDLR